MNLRSALLIICMAISLAALSCAGQEESTPRKKLVVVATLFPLCDFAKSIAGPRAEVTLLLPPGAEPHTFEPRPTDILRLNRADVFLYTSPDMEPWAADILKGVQNRRLEVVDSSAGIAKPLHGRRDRVAHHPHAGTADPHIWLDFSLALRMMENIRDGLIKADPAGREVYEKNASLAMEKLQALDDRYRRGLEACEKKILVNSGHFAFDYMARRYGFRYVSVYGVSPDAEPTAATLAKITRLIRENGLRHLFHEDLVNPRLAETLAKESGVELLKLYPAGNLAKEQVDRGETFQALMEKNLENLRTGMQCR